MNETRDLCELAPLFGLGVLDDEEARAFELHAAACPGCAAEVVRAAELGAVLATSAAVEPPPSLRERVLETAIAASGGVLVRSHQGEWVDTPFPGVQTKRLFFDEATGSVTMLVRVGPGGYYPSHFHAGLEHSYVLEGDLSFSDHTLYAGDYEVAGSETSHSHVSSKNGCVVLIINHVQDRILNGRQPHSH